ncbi:hypothetical protein Taro_028772 [Colocasia esculenta]|uniref:Uncharacterized protein n=1 Tax=Colocasia esculenta TaxID=4460 RepID=A0A843VM17_COLES|nr:hypothetical protein [Colocasia esculenta]
MYKMWCVPLYYTDCGLVSLARLRPVRGRRTRIKYVIDLTGLAELFRHSWYQSKKFEMTDRRDWGGGGDDPEESTQRMIERIWESLTDIRERMDQQAPVPPVAVPPGDGEAVPVALVPPRVEMWSFRLAVVLGGIGVDANLRILQVPRNGWTSVDRTASLNCVGKRRSVVQFAWELAECSA